MRFRGILLGLALAATLSVTGGRVFAQAAGNPTITVDENGNGTLQFPGALAAPLPGVLAPDPGPGGLAAALTYNLLGPPGLVVGDLIILEPGGGGLISDIIRFNSTGPGNGTLVFYSDKSDGADTIADVGFPTSLYANNLTVTEVGPEVGPNGFTYVPTANQPGFISGGSPGLVLTYVIKSDLATVPEPSTLALCGVMGTLGVASAAWKARRKRTAPATTA
jgi:PEP-CTERM motif